MVTLATIQKVFGSEVLSKGAVLSWQKCFKDCRKSVEDELRARLSSTSRNEHNVQRVHDALHTDCLLSVLWDSAEKTKGKGQSSKARHCHQLKAASWRYTKPHLICSQRLPSPEWHWNVFLAHLQSWSGPQQTFACFPKWRQPLKDTATGPWKRSKLYRRAVRKTF